MIRARILPVEEIERAVNAGGPLAELQVSTDALKSMGVAVVEDDARIVAYWVVWTGLHVEPLWVDPAYRRNPAVIRGIVQGMEALVTASGEPAAFCVIEDGDTASLVAGYATRLGFHEAPGRRYYLVHTPAEELVRG